VFAVGKHLQTAVNSFKKLWMKSQIQDPKYDYRFLLIKELEQRQQKNPAYSLRAFARTLNMSPAYVSQLFTGKRILSEKKASALSQKLKWPAKRKKIFLTLLQYQKAPTKESKDYFFEQIQDLSELDFLELKQDQFDVVAGWHHFAIVELSDLKDFKQNPTWIAKKLDISVMQAEQALERLIRIGLLKEKEGRLQKATPHYRIQDVPSTAIVSFHQHHLESAQKALVTQAFEERDFSGTTVSVPVEKLPEIKELIREFRSKLNQYCSSKTNPDAVYHLAVQFYRLDKDT